MLHTELHKNEPPSNNQTKLNELININFDEIFKYLVELKKFRSTIKVFLIKVWNGILFIPNTCPLCLADVNVPVVHFFIDCHIIKANLNRYYPNINWTIFLQNPSLFKQLEEIPLLLFASYKETMKIHFENVPFTKTNFARSINTSFQVEILRNKSVFHVQN